MILSLAATAVLVAAAAVLAYAAFGCPARLYEHTPSTIKADAELGYTLRPNLDIAMPVGNRTIRVYTNPQGIRVGGAGIGWIEHAEIVAIGDSQTFGNVEYADTYPALLGHTLGTTSVNLGVSGYGLVSAIARYERFAALAPHVVVLGFYYDNLDRALSPCYPGVTAPGLCLSVPHIETGEGGAPRVVPPQDNTRVIGALRARFERPAAPSLLPGPSREFCWSLRTELVRYFPAGRPFGAGRRQGGDAAQLGRVASFLLGRLNVDVARRGGRLIVLYIPDYFGEHVVPAPAYLRRAADDLRVPLVDLSREFQAARGRGPDVLMIPGDGHLTPWANRLVAQRLADEIRRDRLLAP